MEGGVEHSKEDRNGAMEKKALDSYILSTSLGWRWGVQTGLFDSCSSSTQTGMPCVISIDLDVHQ